jgi:tetratricopeptide (TPR) repeat protein
MSIIRCRRRCRCRREPARGVRRLVNTPWPRAGSRLPVLALLMAFLTACSSTKPPAPVSELRQAARRDMESGHESFARRNWSSAAAAFARAAEKYDAIDDDAALATALVNQGNAVLQNGEPLVAEKMFQQARTLADRAGSKSIAVAALAGQARSRWCDLPQAIALLQEAVPLATDDPAATATLQNELAMALLKMLITDPNPRDLLQAALATNEKLGRARDVAVNHLNLGRYYLAQSDHDQARQHLDIALERFRKLDDPLGLAQAHESLAQLYTALNQPDQAAYHRAQALDGYRFLKDQAAIERLTGSTEE